MIKHFADR